MQILTTVSPLLDPPNSENPSYNPPLIPGAIPHAQRYQQAILPTSDGEPIQWTLVATDLAGNEVHMQTPLYSFAADDAGYVSEFDHTRPIPSSRPTTPWPSPIARSTPTGPSSDWPPRRAARPAARRTRPSASPWGRQPGAGSQRGRHR